MTSVEISHIFDITGKVTIVTGAAGGIGRAIALGLAQFGSDVVLADMAETGVGELVTQIERTGSQALPVQVDLTDLNDIDRLVAETMSRFGKIDVLVNSVGCNVRRPALQITEEDWDKVIDTNLKSLFFCTRAVGEIMVGQNRGKVINIASVMGLVGSPDYQTVVPYCASKGGVVQLTRAFATEWAKYNVQVNAIAPAVVATPLVEAVLKNREIRDRIEKLTPMGRIGQPEELVGPAVFLASPASSYVTGHILCVDGGWLAQ